MKLRSVLEQLDELADVMASILEQQQGVEVGAPSLSLPTIRLTSVS